MGDLPDDILSGERQAPLAPRKTALPSGFVGHVKLHPGLPASNTMLPQDKNDDG
jgi:hypothetical protein